MQEIVFQAEKDVDEVLIAKSRNDVITSHAPYRIVCLLRRGQLRWQAENGNKIIRIALVEEAVSVRLAVIESRTQAEEHRNSHHHLLQTRWPRPFCLRAGIASVIRRWGSSSLAGYYLHP